MEDSAPASDAVPRLRKHNCTYLLELTILRIAKRPKYLQCLFKFLNQKSVVITDKFGLMSDWRMRLKLTGLLPAGHQADIELTTPQNQQSASISCTILHWILGRVRYYIPQIASDPAFFQPRESLLSQQPLIINQQLHQDAGLIIMIYQPATFRSPRQQMPRVLTSSLIPAMGIAA